MTATTKLGFNLSSFCSDVNSLNDKIGGALVLTAQQRIAFTQLEDRKTAVVRNWKVVESAKMGPTVKKALEILGKLETRFKSSNLLDQSVENFGYYWRRWRVTDKMGYILGQIRDFGITGIKKTTGESDKVEMFIKISSVAGTTFLGYLYGGSIGAFTPIVGYYAIKTFGWVGALATGSALAGNHFLGKIGLIAGPILLGLGRAFYFNKRAPEKAAALKEKEVTLPSSAIGIRVKSLTESGFPKLVVNTHTYSHSLKRNQELTERSLCHFFSKLNKVDYQLEDEVSTEKEKVSKKPAAAEDWKIYSDGSSSETDDADDVPVEFKTKKDEEGDDVVEGGVVVVDAKEPAAASATATSTSVVKQSSTSTPPKARQRHTHARGADTQPKAYFGGSLNPLNWWS